MFSAHWYSLLFETWSRLVSSWAWRVTAWIQCFRRTPLSAQRFIDCLKQTTVRINAQWLIKFCKIQLVVRAVYHNVSRICFTFLWMVYDLAWLIILFISWIVSYIYRSHNCLCIILIRNPKGAKPEWSSWIFRNSLTLIIGSIFIQKLILISLSCHLWIK